MCRGSRRPMSTATTTYAPPLVGAKEPTRPGFVTLTLVEMRKMIDTRFLLVQFRGELLCLQTFFQELDFKLLSSQQ